MVNCNTASFDSDVEEVVIMEYFYGREKKLKLIVMRTSYFQFINYNYIGIDLQTKQAFVVDPAWDLNGIESILSMEEAKLSAIFITHSHIDHVNLASTLAQTYQVPVYISEQERQFYHFIGTNLCEFSDGKKVSVGATQVECITTPGHTFGSACYRADGLCFTGDTVFIEGCGMCTFYGGSVEKMYDSFQDLRERLKGDDRIFPGHRYKGMPGETFQEVKQNNIYFLIEKKQKFIDIRNRFNSTKQFYGI